MPVTLRFQSTGAVPGDGSPIVMRGPSLTIGRGQDNDIVLPDPDRLISKNHCAIEDQAGDVIVIDFSTNGTFLNYGKVPLGRVPTPLNDGDVLTMGAYELVVAITSGVAAASPLDLGPVDDGPVSHGRAEDAPDLMDLLDGGGGRRTDFLDDLMGAEPLRGPSQIVREDPIDALSLPVMPGEEDPILGRIPDPLDEHEGASARYDSASVSDSFAPAARRANVIPDDWDDDFLNPAPVGRPARDPFARGASVVPPPPAAAARAPATDPDADPGPALTQFPGSGQSVVPQPPRPRPPAGPATAEGPSPFAAPVPGARMSVVPPPPARPQSVLPPATPAPPSVAPASVAPPPAAAAPASPPAAAARAAPRAVDAARAFLVGAGADDLVIPDDELAATMERLGGVMKTMIEGLREILISRSDFKGEFRVEKTRLSSAGNNPLKFALSGEHAVEAILRPRAKGYMDGALAVKEALDDIRAHEIAMVTGMEAAIKDVLARLNPRGLGDKAGGGGMSVLSNRKAKLWDEYEKLYGTLAEQAEHDFHAFFARAFSKAYQEQLERLK